MTTIAVMGASGQLGQKTLRAILARGHEAGRLIAAVRTPAKMSHWLEQGVQVRCANYDEPGSLRSAFAGVDRLLLIPSMAPTKARIAQYDHALGAADEAGVGHLFHLGIECILLECPYLLTPFYLYAASSIRLSGLNWTMFRSSMYADSVADWIPTILAMGTIPYPTGAGRCAYVSCDDIARTIATVMTTEDHDHQVYHLTGTVSLSTEELCEIVSRVAEQPVEFTDATDETFIEACQRQNVPAHFVDALLSLYHAIRDGFFTLPSDDIERLTGEPAESFESFLRRRGIEQR